MKLVEETMKPFKNKRRMDVLISIFCIIAFSQIIGSSDINPDEVCVAVKFDMNTITPKGLQVLYCYMNFAQSGSESMERVLDCIEENGIELSDPDIQDVIQVMPKEECVEDIIEKKDALDSGQDYTLQADLDDDKLATELNISDSVMCIEIHTVATSENPKLLHENVCFTSNTDQRIVSYSRKQNLDEQITDEDKTDLVYAYFQLCDTMYQSRFEQHEVTIDINLVTFPGECQNTERMKTGENAIVKYRGMRQHYRVAIYILLSVGLLGNLICLIVCCRPSFVEGQHISYYVIARCIYDTVMLIFCFLRAYAKGDELGFEPIDQVGDSTEMSANIDVTIECISLFSCFMTSELGTVLLTLVISLERLLAVVFPFKAKRFLNHSNAKKATMAVVCITIVIPAALFIPNYMKSGWGMNCQDLNVKPDQSRKGLLYFTICWTGFVIFLPWLFILAFTVTTIWKLKKASIARRQMTGASSANQNDPLKRTRLMALVTVITFLVALVPEIVLNCLSILDLLKILSAYEEQHISTIILILLALKSSLNFVVCIVANADFREIFLRPCRSCTG